MGEVCKGVMTWAEVSCCITDSEFEGGEAEQDRHVRAPEKIAFSRPFSCQKWQPWELCNYKGRNHEDEKRENIFECLCICVVDNGFS